MCRIADDENSWRHTFKINKVDCDKSGAALTNVSEERSLWEADSRSGILKFAAFMVPRVFFRVYNTL